MKSLWSFFCENNLNITFWYIFKIKNNIDYYIIALPTDYDEKIGSFTKSNKRVSKILRWKKPNERLFKVNSSNRFFKQIKKAVWYKNIIFVPEFL